MYWFKTKLRSAFFGQFILDTERPGRPCASCGLGSSSAFIFQADGYVEGKDSDKTFQGLSQFKRNPIGANISGVRGDFVNTVGLDENLIRQYAVYQEIEEPKDEDQQRRFDFQTCRPL